MDFPIDILISLIFLALVMFIVYKTIVQKTILPASMQKKQKIVIYILGFFIAFEIIKGIRDIHTRDLSLWRSVLICSFSVLMIVTYLYAIFRMRKEKKDNCERTILCGTMLLYKCDGKCTLFP